MSHEELKRKIKTMKPGHIEIMSPSNFAMLTDNFCEELVKYILIQGETNERQRVLIKLIKNKYGEWRKEIGDVLWGSPLYGSASKYPEYIKSLDFDIECGETIEEGEDLAEIETIVDKILGEKTDSIDNDGDNILAEKGSFYLNTGINIDDPDENEHLKERIAELEAENKELKEKQTIPEEADELEEKEQEDVLYNKVSFECFLRLLEKAGFDINNTGNKTRAGGLWHMLTGKSADDLRKFCSGRNYCNNHTKEDITRLNAKLEEMGIEEIKLE